jgi:chromosome segregation ATPase
MKYYETLSEKAKARTASFLAEIKKIEKTLHRAKRNLESEESGKKKLEDRISKLKSKSSDYLGEQAFGVFKKNLSRLKIDLETVEEGIAELQKIISEKETSLARLKNSVEKALDAVAHEGKAQAAQVISDLRAEAEKFVDMCVVKSNLERINLLESLKRLYEDFNIEMIIIGNKLVPASHPEARIKEFSKIADEIPPSLEAPEIEEDEPKEPEPVSTFEDDAGPGMAKGKAPVI